MIYPVINFSQRPNHQTLSRPSSREVFSGPRRLNSSLNQELLQYCDSGIGDSTRQTYRSGVNRCAGTIPRLGDVAMLLRDGVGKGGNSAGDDSDIPGSGPARPGYALSPRTSRVLVSTSTAFGVERDPQGPGQHGPRLPGASSGSSFHMSASLIVAEATGPRPILSANDQR